MEVTYSLKAGSFTARYLCYITQQPVTSDKT